MATFNFSGASQSPGDAFMVEGVAPSRDASALAEGHAFQRGALAHGFGMALPAHLPAGAFRIRLFDGATPFTSQNTIGKTRKPHRKSMKTPFLRGASIRAFLFVLASMLRRQPAGARGVGHAICHDMSPDPYRCDPYRYV